MAWSVEHCLGGCTTYGFQCIDNPLVNLIVEAVQVNVVLLVVEVTVNVDGVAGELRGELDVQSATANGKRHLVGAKEHLGMLGLLVDADGGDLGRAQGALDEQDGIAGVVDHVDVLVAQLSNDAMDSRALDAHACAHRVDAVVVALNGNLGALAWLAGHGANHNQAIVYLGHLKLKEAAQELVAGA